MRTWLSKPIYELLPWFYLAAAILLLAASVYVDYWYWRSISLFLGLALLAAGAVVWWQRRRYRRDR
jgi:hypothetical protein